MRQPNLFERKQGSEVESETLLLFALGEFQKRGKLLAGRELPLDRLRGAFKRAAEHFGVEELSDEAIVESLARLGADVRRVPTFVAKHPFRVTVSAEVAESALATYERIAAQEKVTPEKVAPEKQATV